MNDFGHVFWLFGLSGSGKSTLARLLRSQLQSISNPLMLDGDRLRLGLCRELGYSDGGRTENLRRASEIARIAIESGIDVLASFITPQEAQRHLVQQVIGRTHVSFVYVSASIDVCRARDVKGLYSKTQQGVLSNMSGVDAVFDHPDRCDLVIDTANSSVTQSGAELFRFARSRLRGANVCGDKIGT